MNIITNMLYGHGSQNMIHVPLVIHYNIDNVTIFAEKNYTPFI